MLTQTLVTLLMILNAEVQTVTIECPGVTCRGRFSDSLQENIVDKTEWIKSVSITYPDMDPTRHESFASQDSWGDVAQLVFKIDRDRTPKQLARVLTQSGYYASTEDWILVERTPFSQFK